MCMHNEWEWLCTQPEGQFLERKGLTDIKSAVDKIAETLVAMANAEGGTVVFGIEDDGTVSGVPERLLETGWLIPEGERKGRKYRLAKTLR